MAVLIAIETLLLLLLAVLVAGLLRSHAEILRRLGPPSESPSPQRPDGRTALPSTGDRESPAADIVGTTLSGDPIKIVPGGGRTSTLLAFLSSGCATCQTFWDALRDEARPAIPAGARVVVVTKDSRYESPSKLRTLAPEDIPLVMSSAAWETYGVAVSPYFVFVDGASGRVHGEGTAETWTQVLSLLEDALADAEIRDVGDPPAPSPPRGNNSRARAAKTDEELGAAGIGAGHPSLYSGGTRATGPPDGAADASS